jgi:mRNA-degrading endonuclease toxin of MazEF toxin-antitoxin module
MDQPLGPGRIFWAVYPGDRGDGKTRPMIVVSRRVDILRTGQVVAVVCSTSFQEPLKADVEVRLPSDPAGHCGTRLREDTVAVCDWTVELPASAIGETGGLVPISTLREICRLAGIPLTPER